MRVFDVKVVVVAPYPMLNPVRIRGGVEAVALYLVRGLNTLQGVRVQVLSDTKLVSRTLLCDDNGIPVEYIPVPRVHFMPNTIVSMLRLRRRLSAIGPDIVHSHSAWGALAGIYVGIPTVYTIHGVVRSESKYLAPGLRNKLGSKLLYHLCMKAAKMADHCIAVSNYVRSEFDNVAHAVTIVPNPVDDSFFELSSQSIPGRLLCDAFIGKRKNILGLVRSFEKVKKRHEYAELVIAGAARDSTYYGEVLDYVCTSGLQGSVYFVGQIDQVRLLSEYAKADIVCNMSWHETFSLTLAQGMAAGKAVIGTNCGGPSDFVEDSDTGYLVQPGDEQAFAERCCYLLADRDALVRMGVRAREIAESKFRKEVVAARTLKVYRAVLDER
ncbi:MAG: glycosyltransferase family 4 protein [Armatimonadota bacterium]